jgi:hypothetical protein
MLVEEPTRNGLPSDRGTSQIAARHSLKRISRLSTNRQALLFQGAHATPPELKFFAQFVIYQQHDMR